LRFGHKSQSYLFPPAAFTLCQQEAKVAVKDQKILSLPLLAQPPLELTDQNWLEVLTAVDKTYTDLIDYQERLERQNTELEDLRRFLASILGSVSDILIATTRDGVVQEISASLTVQTGMARQALVGRYISDLFDPANRVALEAAIYRVQSARSPVTLELGLLTKAEQTPSPLELSLSPRLDDRGRVVGMVLSGRPLGELRQAYADLGRSHDALKTTQTQLVRNEKLASLGRLLAGVAHELNNPISFVYANTHALGKYVGKFESYFARVQAGASRDELIALRAELKLDREVKNLHEAVEGARAGAERVRDIVADLRRLSSEGSGELVEFDLAETAHVAGNWVLRASKQSVEMRFDGPAKLMALGRPGHVQQVVMNLVQNAVDALEGMDAARVTVQLFIEEGRAVLEVADNGPGIPEAMAQAIFDPFFTTKPVGRGTGLGLSISNKIAEEHGGRLRLVSQAPEGARFRLDLPLPQGDLR
jgi:two-component system, NtrC family, sensor histidine kinase HupT/HoxJ